MSNDNNLGGILAWHKVGEMPAERILLKLLLYGDSGVGKTWTACTAPAPCFLLAEPNGLNTIRAANPDAVVVQCDEAHGGMNTVRNFVRAAKDGELAAATGCKTVVIDSLNELQRMLRDEILASKVGTQGAGQFTLQDWGVLTDRMRGMVRAFRDLPFNVIGITHAEAADSDVGGARFIKPMFQGKALPNEIAGYFSAVGMQYREPGKNDAGDAVTHRRILLEGPPSVVSKGLPGLEPIEGVNLQVWLEKINSYESSGDPSAPTPCATSPRKRSGRAAAANSIRS